MVDQEEMSALIDGFHEAALDPQQWQSALSRLGQAVGGSGVVVLTAYDAAGGAHLLESVGYDRGYWERVQAEHSTPETNRYIRMINAAKPGEVLQPRTAMSLADWLDDPIYRKFLRPDGLGDGLACPLFHRQGGFAAIATFRGRHYDLDHVSLLQAAAPHIRHALNVHLRLQGQADGGSAGGGPLANLRAGIILSDAQARVIYVNPAAQRILDKSDGLSVGRAGSLISTLRDQTIQLRTLVKSAAETALRSSRTVGISRNVSPGGGAMRLVRPSGMGALEMLVSPLRAVVPMSGSSVEGRASVMISLVDPEAGIAVDAAALRQMYGLTAAEARLALQLLDGKDLTAAALAMEVSIHTVKTLLKRAFERTGTHRQTEFVAKILGSPLGLVRTPH
jgi:DNA-binding CsgD family transcriptional regulator